MFAVPGWSVSATALKAQTAPLAGDSEGKKSKKRKRPGKEKPNAVTGENVAELWGQQFEGKPGPKKEVKKQTAKSEKPNKKQKTDEVETTVGDQAANETQNAPKEVMNDDKAEDVKTAKPQSKKEKQKNKKQANGEAALKSDGAVVPSGASQTPALPPVPPTMKLTPMQAAMRQKLISARFRHLNQTLYTAPSATSLDLFSTNPEMFDDYHAGFRQQVSVWPENPVDTFIATLKARAAVKPKFNKFNRFNDRKRKPDASSNDSSAIQMLPRTHGTCTIADLGCGDARLASTIMSTNLAQKQNLKILSYDLQSPSPHVTKADISALPLEDGSIDVSIFCLALMGTNWIDFIEEAYRVLHWKGELWVAEIKSRFGRIGGQKSRPGQPVAHSVGSRRKEKMGRKAKEEEKAKFEERENDYALATEVDEVQNNNAETDVSGFVEVLRRRGFVLKDGDQSVDLGNKMFVRMEFIKAAQPVVGKNVRKEVEPKEGEKKMMAKPKFLDETNQIPVEDEAKVLKPCLYKIR